jgi:hypothetical protein
MSAPLFTVTDATSAVLSSVSYSNVNAGSVGGAVPLLFWNNKGGTQVLSDAVQCQLTTKTFNGLDTGDTVANGQEIVTNLILQGKCISQGDSAFTAIGGSNSTMPIGNASVGTISGAIGGTYANVSTQIVAPGTVTAGTAQFLNRLLYLYS